MAGARYRVIYTVDAFGSTARRYGEGEVLTAGTPTLPTDLAHTGLAMGWLEPHGKAKGAAPKNRAKGAAPLNRKR